MDKLKNPKIYGPIIAAVLVVVMSLVTDLKPVVRDICAQVAPAESSDAGLPLDDLKP